MENNLSLITIFIQGLLSFFSPCVLPLLPVYIGYLSGGIIKKDENGKYIIEKKKVVINTFFFVFGIAFAFLVLAFGISQLGRFFAGNQKTFTIIGGIIVILFGLYQLGIFGYNKILSSEYKLPIKIEKLNMSPLTALLFGFIFSFAWTPCVGPTLSSVLILAATSKSAYFYIFVYTLGYVLPFLATGIFTSTILSFFAKHKNVVKYTTKIGALLLILIGLLMVTGNFKNISNIFSAFPSQNVATSNNEETIEEETKVEEENIDDASLEESIDETQEENNVEKFLAPDFTLTDQYGNTHTLSDYKGKIVYINFWATWCPPCNMEMPDIESFYNENKDDEEIVMLSVCFPKIQHELDIDGIKEFLKEKDITYPVLFDEEDKLGYDYYVTSYPTSFFIDKEGYIYGYVPGIVDKELLSEVFTEMKNMD